MSSPGGPAAKTERLLNLVIVLLYTRRPLTRSKIREMVPQYGQAPSEEAFGRMFERDKDELRELGIPLVTETTDAFFEDEEGYRIHQRDYALPDIEFAPDEMAVLGLASRTWAAASLAGPAAAALRKLRAAGVERDEESLIGIEPRLRTVEPSFDAVRDALLKRLPISFSYRRPDADEATTRRVQPWSLLSWHGRWYLSGLDVDKEAPRVFRLSRIEGGIARAGKPGSYEVPADHDPQVMVASQQRGSGTPSPAVVRVRAGRGHALRRRARTIGQIDDVWDLVDVEYADVEAFASELAAYGPDVIVEQPAELSGCVRQLLAAAAEAHGGER